MTNQRTANNITAKIKFLFSSFNSLYSFSNLIFSCASNESVVDTTVVDSALGDIDDVFDGCEDVAVVENGDNDTVDWFDSAVDSFGLTCVDDIGVVVDTEGIVEVSFSIGCVGLADTTVAVDSVDRFDETFTAVAEVWIDDSDSGECVTIWVVDLLLTVVNSGNGEDVVTALMVVFRSDVETWPFVVGFITVMDALDWIVTPEVVMFSDKVVFPGNELLLCVEANVDVSDAGIAVVFTGKDCVTTDVESKGVLVEEDVVWLVFEVFVNVGFVSDLVACVVDDVCSGVACFVVGTEVVLLLSGVVWMVVAEVVVFGIVAETVVDELSLVSFDTDAVETVVIPVVALLEADVFWTWIVVTISVVVDFVVLITDDGGSLVLDVELSDELIELSVEITFAAGGFEEETASDVEIDFVLLLTVLWTVEAVLTAVVVETSGYFELMLERVCAVDEVIDILAVVVTLLEVDAVVEVVVVGGMMTQLTKQMIINDDWPIKLKRLPIIVVLYFLSIFHLLRNFPGWNHARQIHLSM